MTVGQSAMKHPSLAGMVDAIHTRMSRQALHYRFTREAVDYLYACLKFVFKQKICKSGHIQTKILRPFNRVLIFDSSSWDVHPQLRDVLHGSGGSASSANCKLQAGYEYKKGELCFFQITAGTKPDNKYTDQLPTLLHKNDLALIDQGYFKLKTFQSIDRKGAFYLTRFLVNTNVRDAETMTPIELANILKKLRQDAYQMHIIMESGKEEIHSRLICLRVSEQVAAKRRRRLKKEARKKGRNVSQRHLSLCDWTLMVTNVPEMLLPSEMVYALYRLRWQIELIFKQLKSILCIHQSVTSKENRLRCEIYGKLIMAVLLHRIHASINITLWNKYCRELSMDKLYKRMQERAFTIMQLLLQSRKKAMIYISKEIDRLIKNCLKSIQSSRRTTLEMLENGSNQQVEDFVMSCLT